MFSQDDKELAIEHEGVNLVSMYKTCGIVKNYSEKYYKKAKRENIDNQLRDAVIMKSTRHHKLFDPKMFKYSIIENIPLFILRNGPEGGCLTGGIEHIQPVYYGGKNDFSNMLYISQSLNKFRNIRNIESITQKELIKLYWLKRIRSPVEFYKAFLRDPEMVCQETKLCLFLDKKKRISCFLEENPMRPKIYDRRYHKFTERPKQWYLKVLKEFEES